MQFTQHNPEGLNVIRSYGADFVTVNGEEIRTSCIVGPDTLIRDWPPRDVPSLEVVHLAPLLELSPEVVVLSTGARQQFPRAALRAEFATRKIGIEVMEIGAACRTYNVLVSEGRKVLAAVLLPG
ncbi:MAG TPA: Mth938-like domain-containing protein [Steroidobacteraceae bacterium]|nr:Mth938-like domain-containing protein [Steroidobacteraceae bacterium]